MNTSLIVYGVGWGLIIIGVVSAIKIIYPHAKQVVRVPQFVVDDLARTDSLLSKTIKFINAKQRRFARIIVAKVVRRLKVFSLKIDNLATKLLAKLNRE